MAQLAITTPALTGTAPTATAASAGGDTVANPKGTTMLRVINGGGGSINVTLTPASSARPADGQWPAMTLSPIVVAVPAGAARLIGPIPPVFNDVNGNVAIAYSGVTSVTVEAIQLG